MRLGRIHSTVRTYQIVPQGSTCAMPRFFASLSGCLGARAPQAPETAAPAQPRASRLSSAPHEGLPARSSAPGGQSPVTNTAAMAPRTALAGRQVQVPQPTLQPAAQAAIPWTAEGAIGEMSALSSVRVKRWFKKSASEQYLYAKSLAPEQRNALEQALEQRFRNPQDPQAGAALDMWLSVQQARLRTHTPEQRRAHRVRQFRQAGAIMETWRRYHASSERPEYHAAFNNFLRIIGDESVGNDMRMQVAQRLAYHCSREGTVTEPHMARLRGAATPEWRQHLNGAIPAHEPLPDLVAGAFAEGETWHARQRQTTNFLAQLFGAGGPSLEQVLAHQQDPARILLARVREAGITSLEQDLAQQRDPLGSEISGWLAAAKQDGLPQASAFDDEPLARSFARMLARRRPSQENCSRDADKVLQEGARVIRAIAEDPELRATVFRMAECALASCGDNVAEGFSNVVLAVSRHQMVKAVERGEVDSAGLNRDTRQQFRLAVLEHEVHRRLAEILKPIEEALTVNKQAAEANEKALKANEEAQTANQEAADKLKRIEARLTTHEQAARNASPPPAQTLKHLMLADQRTKLERTMLRLTNERTELEQTKLQLTEESKVLVDLQYKPKYEAVQTMLHAKVQLARQLDLPKGLPTTMAHEPQSVLQKEDLDSMAATIRASEADGSALRAFVLNDPEQLWLTAMKKLHADELKPIWKEHDDNPVWAEDLRPGKGEKHDDWAAGYESRCHAVRQKAEAAERELLFRLAGM